MCDVFPFASLGSKFPPLETPFPSSESSGQSAEFAFRRPESPFPDSETSFRSLGSPFRDSRRRFSTQKPFASQLGQNATSEQDIVNANAHIKSAQTARPAPSQPTGLELKNLPSGQKVWVRVRAVNTSGTSTWSDPACKRVP